MPRFTGTPLSSDGGIHELLGEHRVGLEQHATDASRLAEACVLEELDELFCTQTGNRQFEETTTYRESRVTTQSSYPRLKQHMKA